MLRLMLIVAGSCSDSSEDVPFDIQNIFIGNQAIDLTKSRFDQIPIDLTLDIIFSAPVDVASASNSIFVTDSGELIEIDLQFSNDNKNLRLRPKNVLPYNSELILQITDRLKSVDKQSYSGNQWTFMTINGQLQVSELSIDEKQYNAFDYLTNVSLNPTVKIRFSLPINEGTLQNNISLEGDGLTLLTFMLSETNTHLDISTEGKLLPWTRYTLKLKGGLKGANGETFESIEQEFYTTFDDALKYPEISDEDLLTLIQSQTFKYFWDFGHPNSGMAKERNRSGDLVTSGGSGFGLMAMIVGVERGFITRNQALERWEKIFSFLQSADRFHGAWSHWIDGITGKVRPFSERDNGGDIVETAFLVQGMLTVRQYLDSSILREADLINKIDQLWQGVEWDWYTRGGENVITWHWSPDREWAINLKVRGHNETQIVYILAAASPTFPVDAKAYHDGYARSGNFVNGKSFYGHTLPLGQDLGGPLFFTHYSYLGLDPRNLKDQYADYWIQNVNHTLINRSYCVDNPHNFIGYSEDCWGLTASDGNQGYSAHSPNNDRGVITPTAAISSIPYAPEASMEAIRHFYYILGDKLWGDYGFYDAFNPTEGWVANSYLAIDQGPIICMIENHRTGLLWDLFMSAREVKSGLDKLGFTY